MKKEYLLLVVAIVALGALLFYQKQGKVNYQLPKLPAISDAADRLVVEKGGQRVELRRVDGKWVIEPQAWRANQERVDNMVDELKKIKLSALISEKKNYLLYELTPEKRLTASLYMGDQLLRQVMIGKCSSTYRQTYVMLKDDPRVYQALGNLKNNFFSTVDELRDKTVLKIDDQDLAAIDEVTLERNEKSGLQTLVMVKVKAADDKPGDKKDENSAARSASAGKWQLKDGGTPVKDREVAALLKVLSHLQCSRYLEEGAEKSFGKPFYRVVAKGGGREFSIALQPLKDGSYPAVSSYAQGAFLLPKWKADKIVRDFSVYTGEKSAEKKVETGAGKSGKGEKHNQNSKKKR